MATPVDEQERGVDETPERKPRAKRGEGTGPKPKPRPYVIYDAALLEQAKLGTAEGIFPKNAVRAFYTDHPELVGVRVAFAPERSVRTAGGKTRPGVVVTVD